jgi:hypothetical protein
MRAILFLFILIGCAKVSIKDAEWCGDAGDLGASCFHTLTEETRDIPKSEWDAERFGQVCTKAQTFKDMKVAIEGLCSVSTVRCSYEVEKILQHMEEQINALDEKIQKSSSSSY